MVRVPVCLVFGHIVVLSWDSGIAKVFRLAACLWVEHSCGDVIYSKCTVHYHKELGHELWVEIGQNFWSNLGVHHAVLEKDTCDCSTVLFWCQYLVSEFCVPVTHHLFKLVAFFFGLSSAPSISIPMYFEGLSVKNPLSCRLLLVWLQFCAKNDSYTL